VPKAKGILLDNTMPQMHLTEAERPVGDAGRTGCGAGRGRADPGGGLGRPWCGRTGRPGAAAEATEDAELVLRQQVMGEYFDMMRGFLAQQQSVMDRFQPEAFEAEAPDLDPVAAATGFLDEILEQDAEHLVARST
jgi:hypothetical protein